MHLHLAAKGRTARFRQWLHDNPDIPLRTIADYFGRNYKTAQMWRTGRPSEIPDHTLRLLEQPGTLHDLRARAQVPQHRAGCA